MVKKRNAKWYTYFSPFKDKKIGLMLNVRTKTEAHQIEALLLRACRTGEYGSLNGEGKDACLRLFINQQWELPSELTGNKPIQAPQTTLTLWKAAELFFRYPEIRAKDERARESYRNSIFTWSNFPERMLYSKSCGCRT